MNIDKTADFHVYLYGPDAGPIDCSFETAQQRLLALSKLYFEPDGSFVWATNGGREQIFGMLYDAAERIQYCELRGRCTAERLHALCFAIKGELPHELMVLKLPLRQWQNLQDFIRTSFPEKI